jgi:hypothetical protein
MHLLRAVTLLSALKGTLANAGAIPAALLYAPESALISRGTDYTPTSPIPDVLEKRQHTCAAGQILVYSFPNSSGSYAFLCTSRWTFAQCLVLVASFSDVIPCLVTEIKDWVRGNAQDASDAGPQVGSRSTALTTWGKLYNHTSTSQHTSNFTALNLGLPENALNSMQFHEDGFSATIELSAFMSPSAGSPLTNSSLSSQGNPTCYEQIHIHYWAAAGHTGTVLDDNGLMDLANHAIDDSYNKNYDFACYEMSNGGPWDGWLRVCYNYNQPQYGCGPCGGHNN